MSYTFFVILIKKFNRASAAYCGYLKLDDVNKVGSGIRVLKWLTSFWKPREVQVFSYQSKKNGMVPRNGPSFEW